MSEKEIGVRLTADDQVSPKVKTIKQELREAQVAVIELTKKFGATSKEVAGVAMYAAELKDQMQSATHLIDAFNPDTKFKAFGASVQTVVGGFTALTGAMGLLGVESEDVQKTLIKVQSALAISQGVAQLQEGIKSFQNLGAVILNTLGKQGLLGIALVGLAALGAAIFGVFDGASVRVKVLNDSLKELSKAQAGATKEVLETNNAFKQAELGIISQEAALKKYNTGLGQTVGQAKDLNEAEKLTATNAAKYIEVQGLKAQANYILQKSSELVAEATIQEAELSKVTDASFIGRAKGIFEERIAQHKKDADDLLKLIDGINVKIAAAQSGFKTTASTTPTQASTPKMKAAEDEYVFIKGTVDKTAMAEADALERTRLANLAHAEAVKAIDDDRFQHSEMVALAGYKVEENMSQAKIALADEERKAKEGIAQVTADTLGSIADLIGRDTAAGKVLAIAQATINTYLGASKAIAQGGIYGTIAAIGVIASGLAQVKRIIAVKLPAKYEKGGGSASPGVAAAPLTPQRPGNQQTTLDQNSLNAIGNATQRAYVIETDMTTNQEKVRRINRAARIG